MKTSRYLLGSGVAIAVAALLVAACGGGGSSSSASPAATSNVALSSGTVTAFGSVFVNGHEFDVSAATVSDDDGESVTKASLDVGMTVDVTPSPSSTTTAPRAQEVRIVPMVRGQVDASDTGASQLSVMGQVVQLTASSVFRDRRACAQPGAASACTPITSQAGLTAACTQTAGAAYVCGMGSTNSVQVFGFVNPSNNTVTATLVRVIDNAASLFRATGAITVASAGTPPSSYSINGLSFASSLTCAAPIDCGFSTGDIVFTRSTVAPTLGTPSTALPIPVTFQAISLHRSHSTSLTVGSTIEIEGQVYGASGSAFNVQGVTVTVGTGLLLPANGDMVEVTGTVTAAAPPAVTATSIGTEDGEAHRHGGGFLLQGALGTSAVTTVSPATTPASYNVAILGTSVLVNGLTRFEDETTITETAFNINTFATYLAALTSPNVVVRGYIDNSSGTPVLVALDFRIVAPPLQSAGFNARIDGKVTALASGGLTVDGIPLSFSGVPMRPNGSGTTLAMGDYVRVRVSDNGGTLTVVSVTDFGAANEAGGD